MLPLASAFEQRRCEVLIVLCASLLHTTPLWFYSSTVDAVNVRTHEVVYKKTSFPSDRQLRGIWIRRRFRHHALFHCQDQTAPSRSEQPIETRERKTFSPLREWHLFQLYVYNYDGCGRFVSMPCFYGYTSFIIDLYLPKARCKCSPLQM